MSYTLFLGVFVNFYVFISLYAFYNVFIRFQKNHLGLGFRITFYV